MEFTEQEKKVLSTIKDMIPEGYEIIDFRIPVKEDLWIDRPEHVAKSGHYIYGPRIIVKKAHKWPELVKGITMHHKIVPCENNFQFYIENPKYNIKLIKKNYHGLDLISIANQGFDMIYLGHWNDGIPEDSHE